MFGGRDSQAGTDSVAGPQQSAEVDGEGNPQRCRDKLARALASLGVAMDIRLNPSVVSHASGAHTCSISMPDRTVMVSLPLYSQREYIVDIQPAENTNRPR
jgi:hypothetical protein